MMQKVAEIQQALQIAQAVYDAFQHAAKPSAKEYEWRLPCGVPRKGTQSISIC